MLNVTLTFKLAIWLLHATHCRHIVVSFSCHDNHVCRIIFKSPRRTMLWVVSILCARTHTQRERERERERERKLTLYILLPFQLAGNKREKEGVAWIPLSLFTNILICTVMLSSCSYLRRKTQDCCKCFHNNCIIINLSYQEVHISLSCFLFRLKMIKNNTQNI